MERKVYEALPEGNIPSADEIAAVCEKSEIPDYADVIPYGEMEDDIENHAITDYDGGGYMVLDGQEIGNAPLWINDQIIHIIGHWLIPFETAHQIFGDRLQFAWYTCHSKQKQ